MWAQSTDTAPFDGPMGQSVSYERGTPVDRVVPYGGPMGQSVSYERVTPVHPASRALGHIQMSWGPSSFIVIWTQVD